MKLQNSSFLSIDQLKDQLESNQSSKKVQVQTGSSFQQILEAKKQESVLESTELKFSKHATSRLENRNITLTSEQVERLYEGTKQASEKGIKDSLVVMDQLAFIVNVPNSTVVTAMDQTETKNNIFTNIDGAVIV